MNINNKCIMKSKKTIFIVDNFRTRTSSDH